MTYYCASCLRPLGGPTGAACPYCRGTSPRRVDLLIAVLVGVAVGAALLVGAL